MFYNIMRIIVYPFILIFLRPVVKGKENIPKNGGYILCANHVSMADVFALAVPFKKHIRYMAKWELFKFPPLRWMFLALGSFAVKRGEGDTGSIDKACEILENGGVFGIFPEGTRSKGGPIGKAKSGAAVVAAKTKATLVPVSIRYSSGKYRLFCKTYINIGKPILYTSPVDSLSMRGEIRKITNNLMQNITSLWEESV